MGSHGPHLKTDRYFCSVQDVDLCQTYFPNAMDYSPEIERQRMAVGNPKYSNYFDFDSIMIYSTFDGGLNPILERVIPDGFRYVFMGGGDPPSISNGDIQRISQLYPVNGIHGRDAANVGNGNSTAVQGAGSPASTPWQALRVVIPGLLTTTVRPASTMVSGDVRPSVTSSRFWNETVLFGTGTAATGGPPASGTSAAISA